MHHGITGHDIPRGHVPRMTRFQEVETDAIRTDVRHPLPAALHPIHPQIQTVQGFKDSPPFQRTLHLIREVHPHMPAITYDNRISRHNASGISATER